MTVLALVEVEQTRVSPLSLQTLTFGRGVAADRHGPLEAVSFDAPAAELVRTIADHGAARLHLASHPGLRDYAPDAWARSLIQLIEGLRPEVVIGPPSDRGTETLARAAAMLGLPMAANCVAYTPGSIPVVVRLRWGGSLLEEAELAGTPRLLTVAPYMVEAREAKTPAEAEVVPFSPALTEQDFRVRVVAREETAVEGATLATASVVVGGGRGVGSAEGFRILEELAGLLDGVVGGSRVATNNGWRAHAQQIGLTGNRIAPELYIACGISGAIQHYVGCKGARNILVINKDREAPFFRRATYGVVGDLHEILPALIAELRKRTE